MREIRQSGSEGGGNEQTVSPYPYFTFSQLHQFYLMPSRNLAFKLQLDLKNNVRNSDNCYNSN